MPRVPGSVPASKAELFDAFRAYLTATGRRNEQYVQAARRFLVRWPDIAGWAGRPLAARLGGDDNQRPFVMFLMLHGHLHPGYDFLLARRKLPSLWRELPHAPMAADITRFTGAAAAAGFTEHVASGTASQVIVRLLIQTGRPLGELTEADFTEFAAACQERERRDGIGWRHYSKAFFNARQVLFHMGVLDSPPPNALCQLRQTFGQRMADVPAPLRPSFVAYLDRLTATHARQTVTGTATRLAHFGRHLAAVDPGITSLAQLDRRRHIETYLTAVAEARSSRDGGPLSASERRARVLAVSVLLNDITEWGWPEAPPRRLVFRSDIPKLPRPLPRYLPPDADRRLGAALEASPNRLAADALLLQRACGLRIGELTDLELDCVHEVPGQGAWLKVPLGKLDTERMVPLDDETVTLIDRIVAYRSRGAPIPHPRTGKRTEFLLTHHGRRLSPEALRDELSRAAEDACVGHVTPHALRHTFATALVNSGVSLQSLMALLGHVSAEMSLRYGRLFDQTVRGEYERALTLAKQQIGALPASPPAAGRTMLPLLAGDWKQAPAIKARLAGGYCLRAPAQGSCQYANICEHCPNFRADASHLAVLAAQRVDAEALAADAAARGWADEAGRHRRLAGRLDALIAQAETG